MRMNKSTKRRTLGLKPLAALLPLLVLTSTAGAVQTGQVTAGSGTINTNGATTTIHQQSDRLIVHWNNFDIAAGEQVQFNQPNATSAVLNRVDSANHTQIDGVLNANGRVFVVNPNGIVVGKSGSINASGVVLSSLDVFESSFMNPGTSLVSLSFFSWNGSPTSAVVNEGAINAGAAGVSLFGRQVVNAATGTISAKATENEQLTRVNLVASNAIDTLESRTTGALRVGRYDSSAYAIPHDGLSANDGSIKVERGDVELGVASIRDTALGAALRNTGSIEATSANQLGGNVYLYSYGKNSSGAQLGGTISGDYVTLTGQNNALLDGTINGTYGTAVDLARYTNSTLTMADNASLSGWNIRLTGDNVVVNGQVEAAKNVQVTGYTGANVRAGALTAPVWTIDNGGNVSTGSGQNGAQVASQAQSSVNRLAF